MRIHPFAIAGGVSITLLAGTLLFNGTAFGCAPVPTTTAEMGSQGFRMWSGPTLNSFDHGSKKICIPKDWAALGEKSSGDGWATFKDEVSGIIIKKAAFREKMLTFVHSAYVVRLVYSAKISQEDISRYEETVRNAFERAGVLFNDSRDNPKREHTVLVTVGIERRSDKAELVYPDPRDTLSVYVQSPTSRRGEELMIHAVTHLYNRERDDLRAYQEKQAPIPAEDFQELEASWSETAFRTSDAGRRARTEYLYNVHTAVQTKNFSLITSGPFNSDESEFENIRTNIIVQRDASFLTAQYGHYILAPLIMTATEGMLVEKKVNTTIETILSRVHRERTTFFNELSRHLSVEEIAEVRSWMFDGVTIPRALVDAGLQHYELQ